MLKFSFSYFFSLEKCECEDEIFSSPFKRRRRNYHPFVWIVILTHIWVWITQVIPKQAFSYWRQQWARTQKMKTHIANKDEIRMKKKGNEINKIDDIKLNILCCNMYIFALQSICFWFAYMQTECFSFDFLLVFLSFIFFFLQNTNEIQNKYWPFNMENTYKTCKLNRKSPRWETKKNNNNNTDSQKNS